MPGCSALQRRTACVTCPTLHGCDVDQGTGNARRHHHSPSVMFACLPANIQTQLVRGMAEVGELVLAEEFRQQAGLPPETLTPPDPGAPASCSHAPVVTQSRNLPFKSTL